MTSDSDSTDAPYLTARISTTNRNGIGQEHVHHAHQRGVDDPAREAGDRAHQRADGDGHEGGEEADLQRGLAALHELGQDVETLGVGAERVPGARGVFGVDEVGCSVSPW